MSANSKLDAARAAIAKHPTSKATALRYYLKDDVGLLDNTATDDLRAEFASKLAAVKGRNAPAIMAECRECVGDNFDGNYRTEIRNCQITDCMLFPVRPCQLKSKVSPQNASPEALSEANDSEVIGKPTPTHNLPKKAPYSTSQPILVWRWSDGG